MDNNDYKPEKHEKAKSDFMRSIYIRVFLVFLFMIVVIIAIVFYSFASEINQKTISERGKQLEIVESSLSKRMEEISSIAYHIGNDNLFYLENISDSKYSGYEMSETLTRYLVGNDFIEHLAYYRLADPDTLYTAKGEIGFIDFWKTYMNLDEVTASQFIDIIAKCTEITTRVISLGGENRTNMTYICPLPQFSKTPKAFVLVMVPYSKIKPVLESQFMGCYGKIAVFDADDKLICELGNLDTDIPVDIHEDDLETIVSYSGAKYVIQKRVSEINGWTYVSIIRLNDMIAEVARKQILFIVILVLLMIVALFIIIKAITSKYRPINEKAQKFESAYYVAEAANQAKSTFLSNISHDIRTPMNAIVGMTEMAIKHPDDKVYVKDCLQNVRVASRYLLDILNNVLDMSRIESGKLTLAEDTVDISKVIHGIITILNHNMEVKSLKLSVEIQNLMNEKVICDNIRLTQVFMNIMSNAVKYTPNEGTISIEISQNDISEEGYGDYSFKFSDTGVGMSPEFVGIVFDTFTRDENANIRKTEGTGLGMAIAKRFVDMMGGNITCESELGVGTVFTVTLHLKLAEDTIANKVYDRCMKASVLICGSNDMECLNQQKVFNSLGVKADYALNISDAKERIRQNKIEATGYDYILLNQSDTDSSGIEVMKEISSIPEHEKAVYILVARNLSHVERSNAVDAGISAFIQYPIFRSTAVYILEGKYKTQNDVGVIESIDLTGKKVLLVEDNPINRKIAKALLAETKAEVYEAFNGREAVEAFKERGTGFFNIILMDVQMPVMDGYEATTAIRSIDRSDALSVPIIAMTANTFDEDVRQVKEAGMDGHVGKPYSIDELYQVLSNFLL